MSAVQQDRRSQVLVWLLVLLLAIVIVLAVLVRVVAVDGRGPREEFGTTYIVSPCAEAFVAVEYRGEEALSQIKAEPTPA